jgi:hypothetical protein
VGEVKNRQQQSKIPEAVLKRWWWRRLVFVKFDEENHTTRYNLNVPEYPSYGFSGEWNMWHRKDELTAFRFELLRRTSFPDLPEWHSLPGWLDRWILGVLAPKPARAVCGMSAPTAPTGYASLGGWMWDLTASDESLYKSFIGRINEERRRKGLPDTNDPFGQITGKIQKHTEKRRGERNRQVSWLAVEAHDIKSFGVRPLTDGERSRLSKARREIAAFEDPLKAAIESAKQHTPETDKAVSGEESLYARFIHENFVRRLAS